MSTPLGNEIDELRRQLAEERRLHTEWMAQQEPCAWMDSGGAIYTILPSFIKDKYTPLYKGAAPVVKPAQDTRYQELQRLLGAALIRLQQLGDTSFKFPDTTVKPTAQDCVSVPRPTIVCLCGSTRFKDAFDEANYQETMAGRIVLSVGFFMHASGNKHGESIGATPEEKIALDELHKRKIELSDEVLILNVDGYIGSSTRSELEHALKLGKYVRYLEPNEPTSLPTFTHNEHM